MVFAGWHQEKIWWQPTPTHSFLTFNAINYEKFPVHFCAVRDFLLATAENMHATCDRVQSAPHANSLLSGKLPV